ncbi:transcription regulator [Agrilactobacillus composti DSM 18527 = JCM 14202]|nr:MerR family transcriptional regulator [Agrilactobacillus composti]GAF41273.1 transcription regulator [Agrilactobacillus composti DSM 18527 = JCM 14202]
MKTIKAVAQKYEVTYDALRFYEKAGLLPPIQRDQQGRRVYSPTDLAELDKLLHLRKLGASVQETKDMLALFHNDKPMLAKYDAGIQLLQHLDADLDKRIAEIQQQKDFLNEANYKFNPNKPGIFQWQSVDDVFLMVVD